MAESPLNDRRMEQCPRFNICSVPKCPLDQFQTERVRLKEDPKCTMLRRIRVMIAQKYPKNLPLKGVTRIEASNALKTYPDLDSYIKKKYGAILKRLTIADKSEISSESYKAQEPSSLLNQRSKNRESPKQSGGADR